MANKGILGRKLGMTQVFDEGNRIVPVTVIEAGPCRVVQIKTPERDGYAAVQLAFGETKAQRLSKPELGHLKAANADPTKYLAELRVVDLAGFELGQVLKADMFAAGERVDVTGISKGHGFAGVMKRHNFSGQGASHGNHKKHRAPGLDRRVRHAGACVQGHEDGRPVRQRAHHHAQPAGRRRRRRAQPPAHPGRGPRPVGRHRVRPQRGEVGGEGVDGVHHDEDGDGRRRGHASSCPTTSSASSRTSR